MHSNPLNPAETDSAEDLLHYRYNTTLPLYCVLLISSASVSGPASARLLPPFAALWLGLRASSRTFWCSSQYF